MAQNGFLKEKYVWTAVIAQKWPQKSFKVQNVYWIACQGRRARRQGLLLQDAGGREQQQQLVRIEGSDTELTRSKMQFINVIDWPFFCLLDTNFVS